jgi:hypothetical protein
VFAGLTENEPHVMQNNCDEACRAHAAEKQKNKGRGRTGTSKVNTQVKKNERELPFSFQGVLRCSCTRAKTKKNGCIGFCFFFFVEFSEFFSFGAGCAVARLQEKKHENL